MSAWTYKYKYYLVLMYFAGALWFFTANLANIMNNHIAIFIKPGKKIHAYFKFTLSIYYSLYFIIYPFPDQLGMINRCITPSKNLDSSNTSAILTTDIW